MVPFRGRFPRRKQRSGSPLCACNPQGRSVPGNLQGGFSGLGTNGAVSGASRIGAELRRDPLRDCGRQGFPCLFSGRGISGAPGMGRLGSGAPCLTPLGGEDNSHAPPGPSASLCCVSWVQNRVLMGERGLAEGELDKLGWRSQMGRAGLGAGEGE